MKYVVTIAGRTVEVEIDGDRVVVDGASRHAELRSVSGSSTFPPRIPPAGMAT